VLASLGHDAQVCQVSDREQRSRIYGIVLRKGAPAEVLTYVGGAMLIDPWDTLVLPQDVRTAWSEVVSSTPEGLAS